MKLPVLVGSGAGVKCLLYRLIKGLIAALLFMQLCIYGNDVYIRWNAGTICRWQPVKDRFYPSHQPPPPYLARYCIIAKYKVLLQLYDADGSKLLAERMYLDLDMGTFLWVLDRNGRARSLIYDTSANGDDGQISIPPTTLDKLQAALP